MFGSFSRLKLGALFGALIRMGTGVNGILIGACLARLLSVEALGLYFLFTRLVRLTAMVVAFGMPNGLQKVVGIAAGAGDWTGMRTTLRNAAGQFALTALAAGAIYLAAWPFLSERLFGGALGPGIAAAIFVIVLLGAAERVVSAFFRAVRHYVLGVFLLGFPREAALVAIFGAMVLAGAATEIDRVLLIHLAVVTATAAGGLALAWRFVARHRGGDGRSVDPSFRAFALLCAPMGVNQVLGDLYNRFDIWVLGFFRPAAEVGVYGAVLTLTMVITFTLNIVTLLIPGVVASTYAKGELERLQRLMRAAATASLLMAIPFAAAYLAFGEAILRLAFGPAFAAGATVLAILTVGRTVSAACGSPAVLLQMTGHHLLVVRITLAIAALILAASLAVVGRYGPEGVATVTALGMIGRNLTMTAFARLRVGIVTLPTLRPADLRDLVRFRAARRDRPPVDDAGDG